MHSIEISVRVGSGLCAEKRFPTDVAPLLGNCPRAHRPLPTSFSQTVH